MKNIKFYRMLIVAFVVMSTSCEKVLDKKPLGIISDDVVWKDPNLVDAYMASQYAGMTILNYDMPQGPVSYWDMRGGFSAVINASDEVGTPVWAMAYNAAAKRGELNIAGGLLEYWELPYTIIRRLNVLIETLPTSTNTSTFIQSRIAEARFLRAFNYFALVKRYGGVPLVTEVLPLDAPDKKMFPPRNTEQEVYNFVLSELDAAEVLLKDLPQTYGRASQGAALALKCRTALYAGSIAQFGTIQLNGLLGIVPAQATNYYKIAYDAAKKIQGLGYRLYNEDVDKVTNFKNIFLKERNNEMIFAKQYDNNLNFWLYGFLLAPKPHGYNYGMALAPSLEMAEEFEYVDGRPGQLDRGAIQQGLWSMDKLWKGKDPRFFASLWTNGTPWKGGNVDSHKGLIGGDGVLYVDEQNAYKGIPAWGNQNAGSNFGTGFGVLKLLNEASTANMDERDGTDCPVFRYGEVLLNLAEAAFELGKTGEALDAINQLRNRAGIAPKTAVDRDVIRHERKVELAFEGHRYWDVRRWRIAENVLSINPSGIRFILDYTASDFNSADFNTSRKYKLQVIPNYNGISNKPLFRPEYYYLPITQGRTGSNLNMIENPGYK